MVEYEKCLDDRNAYHPLVVSLAEEILQLRRMLWLSHGHKGMYGDDGEIQCSECAREYGFWDWKRTPIDEIQTKITDANIKKFAEKRKANGDEEKEGEKI